MPPSLTYFGPQPFAFDRTKMLTGQPATFVSPVGPLGGSVDPFLPADLDGSRLPLTGAPNTFVGFPGQATNQLHHLPFPCGFHHAVELHLHDIR